MKRTLSLTSLQFQTSRQMPRRTCIACRAVRPKPDLIRLVRTGLGSVKLDLSARESGRGAYLCPVPGCWEMGLKRNRLEKALKARVSLEDQAQLAEFGKSFALLAYRDSPVERGDDESGWGKECDATT